MEGRKRTARINIIITAVTIMVILLSPVTGKAEGNRFSSQGKIVFDNRTGDASDDVIFDAGDFNRLAFTCR